MVQQCMVRGNTYIEKIRSRIPCPDCGVDITAVSMTVHQQHIHGTEPDIDWNRLPVSQMDHIPRVFNVSFQKDTSQFPYSFTGCPGFSWTWNDLRNNLNQHHWGIIMQILEEHPPPSPNLRSVVERSRCGASVIGTMSQKNAGLVSRDRDGRRL